jgi:hypothetical protein
MLTMSQINNIREIMPVAEERESRLDPYKPQIQEWLDGDTNAW